MPTDQNQFALLRSIRLLLYILIGVLIVIFLLPRLQTLWISFTAEPRSVTPRGELAEVEKTNIEIFSQASPSVVFITSLSDQINFWTRNITRIPSGTGSGFIWDSNGHIVTNYHVVKGASAIHIGLFNQSTHKAVLVGASPEHDIAVLRMPIIPNMPVAIPIGSSHDLKVGQAMYAIGNPFGLDYTLTTGVVSALNRSISNEDGSEIKGLIQTDTAINPGNSGGPLLDSAGRLVGINTAIYSPSGVSVGIGFAVPVDIVNRIVPQLIAHGRYQRPRLGITIDDRINNLVTQKMDIKGVVIIGIEQGSPVAKAGLRGTRAIGEDGILPGDIILGIGNRSVTDIKSLLDALEQHDIGDQITLRYYRDNEEKQTTVILE